MSGGLNLQHALPNVPRRTLQRRLQILVRQGRLIPERSGRARRYRVVEDLVAASKVVNTSEIVRTAGLDDYVALSPAGDQIRQAVQRQLGAREPVGYSRSFLDTYQPNTTHYLPETLRQHLQVLGRSSVTGRPAGTYARHILKRLLVDLSWASSRLEGNTYTRLDTQNLIEFGVTADGRDQLEAQMILNHKAAIELLVENAEQASFTAYTVCNLHALLSENLLTDSGASGRLREIPVEISGTVYVPLAIPQQIEEYFHRLLAKADAIVDPFEQAFS